MTDLTHTIQVTFVDNGTTVEMTKQECYDEFGVEEFKEILLGYAPHIVAVDLDIEF